MINVMHDMYKVHFWFINANFVSTWALEYTYFVREIENIYFSIFIDICFDKHLHGNEIQYYRYPQIGLFLIVSSQDRVGISLLV